MPKKSERYAFLKIGARGIILRWDHNLPVMLEVMISVEALLSMNEVALIEED